MDLLLSVPVASYFLSPSSFSSTVNLLFFYMTWSTLVLSHPPLRVHVFGILAIRVLLALLPGLISLAFDTGLPSLAREIKHGGRSALPPPGAKRLAGIVGLAVANVLLLTSVEGALSWCFAWVFGGPEFKTSTTLPLPWLVAKHVALLLAARELLVYSIHRHLLHGGSRPAQRLARLHARYAHSRRGAPFALLLYSDHPLPLLLHRLVPVYGPALLLRPHLLTYLLFFAICTGEEAVAMSGYTVVPGIIMGGMVQRSAIHYASGGRANFGAWGILDWINGTSQGRDVLEDVRAEADKHNVKERASRKAHQGLSVVQDGVEAWRGGGESESGSASPRTSGRRRTASKKAS